MQKTKPPFLLPIINSIRKLDVFKRLSIFFLVLIILPTSAITTITYNTYSQEMKKNASDLLSYTTHNVAQAITSQLQYYENIVYQIYLDESLMQLVLDYVTTSSFQEAEELKRTIDHRLYLSTPYNDANIFNLQIITPRGQLTQTSRMGIQRGGYTPDLDKFLASPYYIAAKSFKGHPVWFDTTRESDLFYRQTAASRPIADALSLMQAIPNYYLQDTLGVIVLNVYIKGILENVERSMLNQSGHLLLVSPNSTLASINANLKGPIPNDIPALLEQIDGQLAGIFSTKIKNETCLVSFEKIGNSDFYVLNLAYLDVLLQNAKGIRNFTLFMMLLVILIALFLAYIVTLSITLPLNGLKKALGSLSTEGFSLTVADFSSDELGVVSQHFNEMVEEMKELIHKVYLVEIQSNQLAFKKKEAELNALQMQINPHFLYNTLDIMRWEIIALEQGQGKVSTMVESFSRFLRLSTPKHSQLVPLHEELQHIQTYIDVINYRYTEKIQLVPPVDSQLLSLYLPKLTLQPIIENCIVHAFTSSMPNKTIEINAMLDQGKLCIAITDNGCGISAQQVHTINVQFQDIPNTQGNSIGLFNVCERIHLYFGSQYGLLLLPPDGTGTTVQILLPQIDTPMKRGDFSV